MKIGTCPCALCLVCVFLFLPKENALWKTDRTQSCSEIVEIMYSLSVVLVPFLLFVTRSRGTFCFAARLLLHRSQGGILPSLTLVIQDLNCELADAWGFSLALLLSCWQSNQCSVSWSLPPTRVLPNKMDVQMLLCSPTVLLSLAIPVLPYLSFLCLCSLCFSFTISHLPLHFICFLYSSELTLLISVY